MGTSPISLRDTEGEVAAPCYFCCCRYFPTPPSLRATSPIFCITKHRGGGLKYHSDRGI